MHLKLVARLVRMLEYTSTLRCACRPPIVLPYYHTGMGAVMPYKVRFKTIPCAVSTYDTGTCVSHVRNSNLTRASMSIACTVLARLLSAIASGLDSKRQKYA